MSTGARNDSYPETPPNVPDELRDRLACSPVEEDAPSPEQITLLRAMTGQQRLALAEEMFWAARELKAAGVRCQHPDWPEEQINAEVNRIFLNARG